MIAFGSTLLHEIDLRLPGLHVRSFAVHRLVKDQIIAPPTHHGCRAVLFLEGWSRMPATAGESHGQSGQLMVLPPQSGRCVEPTAGSLALCAIIDFQIRNARQRAAVSCVLARGELLQAREQLAYLLRLQSDGGGPAGWGGSAVVLQLLITLLRAANWLESPPMPARTGGESAMHRLLFTMAPETPLGSLVQQSGYQRDHLNRLVKKETGLTLGQFRAQRRLSRAKEMLLRGVKVGEVAGEVGLPDQSYFARWFRRQTGFSPSQWLVRGSDKVPIDFALQCG